MKRFAVAMFGLLAACSMTGCIVVGHSTRGGWFVWPGGLGLVVVVLIALFLLRGRR
jgi:hypothetical protein